MFSYACVSVCVGVYMWVQVSAEDRGRVHPHQSGGCEHLMWALGLSSHPLKEQCTLLTAKPPHQPQNSHFEMYTFQQLFRTVQSFAIIDFQNMFTSKGNLIPVHFPLSSQPCSSTSVVPFSLFCKVHRWPAFLNICRFCKVAEQSCWSVYGSHP